MWGQIIGAVAPAVIGGIMGNKAAKDDRKNMAAMNAANMASFNQYKPYVDNALSGGEDAFNNALNTGYYQGPTYAGPNATQLGSIGNAANASNAIYNSGMGMMNVGAGFGNNANSLYNAALGNAGNIGNYQGTFDQNIQDQRNLANAYTGLAGNIADAGAQYGNYRNQFDQLGTGFNQLSDTVQGYKSNFDNLASDMRGLTNDVKGYQNQYDNLAGDFKGMTNDLRGYQDQFSGLSGQQQGLTDRFTGMADQAANTDRLGNAMDYATANSGSLIDAAMRDSTRQLQEQTLPGINKSASGSGNVNSSRAGMADAIAQRSYDDRRADVGAQITDRLMDRSLTQQSQQFADQSGALTNAGSSISNTGSQLGNAANSVTSAGNMLGNAANQYGNSVNTLNTAGNMMGNVGNQYNNAINSMNTAGNMMSNAGSQFGNAANMVSNDINSLTSSGNMLGNAGNAFNNSMNAATGATGNIGSMNNALNTAGGFNNALSNAYNTGVNNLGTSYNMGMTAGSAGQVFDQNQLNDARNRFEGNRDFGYNMYKDYMGGMLGRAPQTNNQAQANMASPMTSTLGGMQAGFGMFGQGGNSNFFNPLFGGKGLGGFA